VDGALMARATEHQKSFMQKVFAEPSLIFAAGPTGISVNLVGAFRLASDGREDRIEVGDGTDHVHVDWDRVRSVEHSDFHGEGLLSFKDKDDVVFKFYRPNGAFPNSVLKFCGAF
jgi:hypothetical protein